MPMVSQALGRALAGDTLIIAASATKASTETIRAVVRRPMPGRILLVEVGAVCMAPPEEGGLVVVGGVLRRWCRVGRVGLLPGLGDVARLVETHRSPRQLINGSLLRRATAMIGFWYSPAQ